MNQQSTRNLNDGMTLVEVLIAMAIFASLILIILPITDLFKTNSASAKSLSATTTAQQFIEAVQRDWNNQNNFDTNCANIGTVPTNITVQSSVLALDGTTGGFADIATSCSTSSTSSAGPSLRRLRVQATEPRDNNKIQASFTLDIRRPNP